MNAFSAIMGTIGLKGNQGTEVKKQKQKKGKGSSNSRVESMAFGNVRSPAAEEWKYVYLNKKSLTERSVRGEIIELYNDIKELCDKTFITPIWTLFHGHPVLVCWNDASCKRILKYNLYVNKYASTCFPEFSELDVKPLGKVAVIPMRQDSYIDFKKAIKNHIKAKEQSCPSPTVDQAIPHPIPIPKPRREVKCKCQNVKDASSTAA